MQLIALSVVTLEVWSSLINPNWRSEGFPRSWRCRKVSPVFVLRLICSSIVPKARTASRDHLAHTIFLLWVPNTGIFLEEERWPNFVRFLKIIRIFQCISLYRMVRWSYTIIFPFIVPNANVFPTHDHEIAVETSRREVSNSNILLLWASHKTRVPGVSIMMANTSPSASHSRAVQLLEKNYTKILILIIANYLVCLRGDRNFLEEFALSVVNENDVDTFKPKGEIVSGALLPSTHCGGAVTFVILYGDHFLQIKLVFRMRF